MAGAFKPGKVQVLGVQLDIKELIRPEGRKDPLVGQLVSRMRFVLTVKDQDPLLG
jgi:hypothetical protein